MTRAGALQYAARRSDEAAPANLRAALESPGSQASLGASARVLRSALDAAARPEYPQTSIVAPLPLLAQQAPAEPVKLAAQLKDAIGISGLFYESHLAEWSAGKRLLAELRREPQMQRGLMAATTATATDPATAQFISLQLASQEQGRIAWQGQLLPGQDLSWQMRQANPARPVMADDTIKRKQHSAVALAYQNGDGAPKVLAKGKGLMAQQIIGRAQDAGVFVHESKELVALLMELDLERQIPPALYRAIAELLAWLYSIDCAPTNGSPASVIPDLARLIE